MSSTSSSEGIEAAGTVSGLGVDQTLWLLDDDGRDYTVDQEAVIANGKWSATSAPLGDEGQDLPFDQTVALVLATRECHDVLEAKLEADDSTLASLPAGCTVLATLTVVVDRP